MRILDAVLNDDGPPARQSLDRAVAAAYRSEEPSVSAPLPEAGTVRSSSHFEATSSPALVPTPSGPVDQRWDRVKAVFLAAWERLPNDRPAFLDDACGTDAALRADVESLLAAAARDASSGFLEHSPLLDAEPGDGERGGGLMTRLAAAVESSYAVERELGGGGMARVFLAREVALDRTVVIKVLNPEHAYGPSADRFAREVRFAARLQQANIVPVHRVGAVGDLAYYIMPYSGESLRDRIASGARPTSEALGVMRDIAKALACAHGEGVVHRDIKPENVLISGGTAVVADFGIAKAISAVRTGSHGVSSELAVTADGISLGTPAYMAPEQVAGDPDVGPATDVYAFGVVAYEMLAGVHPFAGKKSLAALMKAHVVEQPRHIMEQRPDLPPELAGLVMRCLEKEPAARPGNGSELLLALDALDASLGVASKPAVPRDKMPVPANAARRSSREPVNPAAFELYQRGRHLVEQRSDGMHEALSCFEQAIELDPNFSAPHAGISMVLTLFAAYHALSPRAAFPRARESAERALAIDPTDALALVMRAHTALWYEWDFQRAETLTRRALELAPGLYLAHDCLGFVLAARAQFDEAISAMERARVLDPHDNATYDLAWILLLAGRWEQAIRDLEPALEKHPRASELRRVLGFCLFYAGHRQEGLAEFRRVLKLHLDDRWGSLNIVQVLAALGEVDEARRLVRSIEERARHEPIPPLGIAIMHHALGDDEIALDWLERSLEARDFWLVMLPFDPSMIGLRDHPRFIRVMERVRGSAG